MVIAQRYWSGYTGKEINQLRRGEGERTFGRVFVAGRVGLALLGGDPFFVFMKVGISCAALGTARYLARGIANRRP